MENKITETIGTSLNEWVEASWYNTGDVMLVTGMGNG